MDPIGIAGGVNLYGFAGGDPVNYSDPFGLWPCPQLCASPSQYIRGVGEAVWNNLAAKTSAAIGFLKDLTPVGDAERSAAAFAEGRYMAGAARAGLALAGAVPGGGGAISGSKAAVRAGLGRLGLSDDLARVVRGILGTGGGQEWGVRLLEEGGAVVNRFVKGGDGNMAVLWSYILDARGGIVDIAKQQYNAAGAVAGSLKNYRP